jgi:protein TonB
MSLSLSLVITAFEWTSVVSDKLIDLSYDHGDDPILENEILPPVVEKRTTPPKPKTTAPAVTVVITEPNITEIPIIKTSEVIPEPELNSLAPVAEKADVYDPPAVDQQAVPFGGWEGFKKHLLKNLKYPNAARRMEIEGRVFVSFVVSSSGKITQVKVLKGIGFGCDEEAVKVVSSLPEWCPAQRAGQAVSVRMVLPIIFRIN